MLQVPENDQLKSASCLSCSPSTRRPQKHLHHTLFSTIAAVTVFLGALNAAQAQSARTYVSRSGKDTNACTEASPCRTLQAALAQTQAGGQIYTLGSADYGYLTINKAISIISGRGATGILATSNLSGITVSAGTNDIINLQGLNIDGASAGANGIVFTSGAALNLKDSVVRGFTTGINFRPTGASSLSATNTLLTNNATAVSFLSVAASTGALADVQLVNNGIGFVAQGESSARQAVVTLQNCVVANNSSVGIRAASYSSVTASNCTITNNEIGLEAQSTSALLQISGSSVTGNGIGWQVAGGGQIISSSNNSIGGNTSGNAAPPTTLGSPPPDEPPTQPTVAARNIVTDFGAKCDGSTDDAPAFAAFNAWARTQSLKVELTIPSGSVCSFITSIAQWWAKDIPQLTVLGYGATIKSEGTSGPGFFLGGRGQFQDNAHSARLSTAAAGSSSVQLLSPAQVSLFSVGRYALITGFDLQGLWNAPYGYPSNPHFFEYVRVTSVDANTGVITFQSPLKNTYKATWPRYNSGSQFEVDNGGPATLYALDPSWDTEVEYRGLTIAQPHFQTYANGRSVTYRDVTFTGQFCGVPTQNLVWRAINTNMSTCIMEVDKLIGTISLEGVTIYEIDFQSSSTDLFSMLNSTITYRLTGTPKKAVMASSTITNFWPGAYAYGRSDEVLCTDCFINTITELGGINDKGPNDVGIQAAYSMSNGVITIPNSLGAVRWAVPGTNLMFPGHPGMFQVKDITQDANNTYVQTTLSGSFPSGASSIRVHPAPKFTCNNCAGSDEVAGLSDGPAGAPLFSYAKRTYTGFLKNLPQQNFIMWGFLSSISINVTNPYVVSEGLSFRLSQFNNWPVILGDSSQGFYGPTVNVGIGGNRLITPQGAVDTQSGDSGLTLGQVFWFPGKSYSGPQFSADVSASCPGPSCPNVTVEIKTDQGVVIPVQ